MSKLTKKSPQIIPQKITSKRDLPFILCFKYPLEKGYTFKELTISQLKQFQLFLDKVSKMSFDIVEKQYLCTSDKADIYGGTQVFHYRVTDMFRIHGVLEEGRIKVIRLDPNHKFHR